MKKIFILIGVLTSINSYAQTFEEVTSKALKAEKEQNYKEAITYLNQALKLDKGNHFIYNKLSLMHYYIGESTKAISYCDSTLNIQPKDPAALYQRGHLYLEKQEFEKALIDFTNSFEYGNKTNASASFNIGKSYAGLGNLDKAIEYYLQTLKLQPNDKYSYYELGYTYATLPTPDKENALKYYTKAIEQDNNYYAPYFNRGLLYAVQLKNPAKAHKDLERSIEISPKNKLSYLYNAMLYRDEKELDKAKNYLDKVIEIYPDYAEAYFERAITWYNIGVFNMVCKDLAKSESLGYQKAKEYKKQTCK